MKIKIDLKSDGKYPLDDTKTFGYFDTNGTFLNWKVEDDIYTPETIVVDIENVIGGKYFNISLCEFCKSKDNFEIHIEEVRDPRKLNYSYNYVKAKNEGFSMKIEDEINVVIILYNSDPQEPEQEYFRCGNFSGQLKFPTKKKKDLFDDPGFGPKVKKGNILIGN